MRELYVRWGVGGYYLWCEHASKTYHWSLIKPKGRNNAALYFHFWPPTGTERYFREMLGLEGITVERE